MLPDGRALIEAWQQSDRKETVAGIDRMPDRFKAILQAMLLCSRPPTQKRQAGKSPLLRPKERKSVLERALMGQEVTLSLLKKALQSCGIVGYEGKKISCKGNAPYVQMVEELSCLLQAMGYKGLVLFFDEAESIVQGRISTRLKSYAVLQQLFTSQAPLYSVFAFTESFFERLRAEDYANPNLGFPRNYAEEWAEEWKELHLVHLRDLSSREWEVLQDRLIQLYADAYQMDVSAEAAEIKKKQRRWLEECRALETRLKLKALVRQLDMDTQDYFLRSQASF